jgi:hypothetical protein
MPGRKYSGIRNKRGKNRPTRSLESAPVCAAFAAPQRIKIVEKITNGRMFCP